MSFLDALLSGDPIDARTAIVAAHPDDETVGIGGRIPLLRHLRVVTLTDGAPRDLIDARREGFADWQSYAAARESELHCALRELGATAAVVHLYRFEDQASVDFLSDIVARLSDDLAGSEAVLTHAFEHGHPDHDTAALAVHLACRAMESRGATPPQHYEFAGYHLEGGKPVAGRFGPGSPGPEVRIEHSPAELARKQRAIDCFRTQAVLLAGYPLSPECVRCAPRYDFTRPPGPALYDRFGWSMTSERWRETARAAMCAMEA
jgi:LmbE family N-acetylglucosaminyl deacetylase